ncbi:copper chaperone PCu(A)C [Streptomyces beihaiensis]|uniref:Copper chaperone PCu(A)C n=1 Tax=Streptomyces beihaiensis TaxID=2984495 RepID=A0ABT3TN58_9ACTN|nr:copper chaperone PCu(A)C [Streptomyces beihaiensis]MCX3058479.1 copper chaperone PCu(A)C [Streptomyces beihaiensis]
MRRATLAPAAIALAAGLTLTACSSKSPEPHVKVDGAFMPAPPTGEMAAGFFVVHNDGGADTLTSASSTIAEQVTLHTTKGGEMTQKSSFAVPADGELDFARGGNHLMFEGLKRRPEEGDKVEVKLHFAKSGTVTVTFPVKAATYDPAPHSSHGPHPSHESHTSQ